MSQQSFVMGMATASPPCHKCGDRTRWQTSDNLCWPCRTGEPLLEYVPLPEFMLLVCPLCESWADLCDCLSDRVAVDKATMDEIEAYERVEDY